MKLLSPQNYTVNFNLQGRVIEATDVDMLGGNTQRTLFHTARGKRKPNSSTAYLYNQKEELLGTFETKLTEDGRLISEKWFIGAVPLTQKFYYYNPDSTLARYRESFLPRFGGNKYEVEYSSINGKPQIIAHYKQMGRLKQRYVYDYNADGQVEYVYSYNSRGDQVSVSHYTYNEQGDMTMAQSDKRFHRGMELLTELFDYHGMPAGVIEKSGTYLFDYQYDEAGNWVKCAVNYDGQQIGRAHV